MNIIGILLAILFLGRGPAPDAKVKLEGEFRSVAGVMNVLSCHCGDGGYITTASGEEIAICFEQEQYQKAMDNEEKWSCERIQVVGKYKESVRVPGENDPCPAGTMTYLAVSKFTCL